MKRDWGHAYLIRTYGQEIRKKFFLEQGGLCAVCRVQEAKHFDHCHSTGKPRGLLCRNCNIAIGHLKDNPEFCEAAATYLRLPLPSVKWGNE